VPAPPYERAIVIGASMAGLCVARALSDHFREVIVIEKDALPKDRPAHRKGVHQSHHIHNLLLRGQYELESFFPGFRDTALGLGAVALDYTKSMDRYMIWGWSPLFESGLIGLSATRILLEHAVRVCFGQQVNNARIIEGTRVESLLTKKNGEHVVVSGVRTSSSDPALAELAADFVVDCAGKGTRHAKWFAELGLPPIEEEIVESHCGYASRFYRETRPEGHQGRGIIIDARLPDLPAWGALAPYEDNTYVLTLGGFSRQYPPTDDEGFLKFAESLLAPDIAAVIKRCEPVGPITSSRSMTMRWRHMDRYKGKISRFMLLGDSLWNYNPLYGQGMSVAAVCASILREQLACNNDLETLPLRVYVPAKKFARPYWDGTALLDMRWKGTEGKRPWHMPITAWGGDLFIKAAFDDNAVYMEMMKQIHMLKTPTELMTPRVLWKVLLTALKLALPAQPSEPAVRLPEGGG
jgi:flavin-dependent dehydrogenase